MIASNKFILICHDRFSRKEININNALFFKCITSFSKVNKNLRVTIIRNLFAVVTDSCHKTTIVFKIIH